MKMKIGKWRVLESTYLIRRPWLTARRDKVELPSGVVHPEYYVLEYPDWINVIARTTDGQYVMVDQYRHGLADVFTELVAGVIEKGEEPMAAARRELLEETGYAGGEWKLLSVISQNPSCTTNLTHCFFADGVRLVSSQKLDETEDISVRLLSPGELADMLLSDSIKQSLMAVPLWKHFALDHPELLRDRNQIRTLTNQS